MNKAERKSLLESIKKDLFASDDIIVAAALSKASKHGDNTLILPLIQVYAESEEGGIKNRIGEMLGSLKVSGAEEPFIEALKDEKFSAIRSQLLSFMWNSDLQPTEYVGAIATAAIQGDYMCAFEALTLIDTLEGPFPDDQLMGAILDLAEYQNENKQNEKSDILNQMISILRDYDTHQ
jgi:HEAT repeat protein